MCAPCQAAALAMSQQRVSVGISTANNVVVNTPEEKIDHCGITYEQLRQIDLKLIKKYEDTKERQWIDLSSEIGALKAIYIYASMCEKVGRINEINNLANA